jgi:hypothetical protein
MTRTPLVVLMALMMGTAQAQDADVPADTEEATVAPSEEGEEEAEDELPDEQEVLAFKGTVNRFVDRMQEFNDAKRKSETR